MLTDKPHKYMSNIQIKGKRKLGIQKKGQKMQVHISNSVQ
uniref:Uncharacterized protein n=1 Tax=Rhizophora mucronata TaxID=61149 RepID=A0A2P2Q7G8_RHIMU